MPSKGRPVAARAARSLPPGLRRCSRANPGWSQTRLFFRRPRGDAAVAHREPSGRPRGTESSATVGRRISDTAGAAATATRRIGRTGVDNETASADALPRSRSGDARTRRRLPSRCTTRRSRAKPDARCASVEAPRGRLRDRSARRSRSRGGGAADVHEPVHPTVRCPRKRVDSSIRAMRPIDGVRVCTARLSPQPRMGRCALASVTQARSDHGIREPYADSGGDGSRAVSARGETSCRTFSRLVVASGSRRACRAARSTGLTR